MTQNNEREAFELNYAHKWQKASENARQYSIEHLCKELKEMRKGENYGEDRDYLNFTWEGWQARVQSPISQNEQQEAVAEIVCDPMFLPALKVPLVSWKADIVKFSIGTKLYTSPPKQAIPEGWKLVPIEPTKEMANAGFEISSTSPSVDEMRSIYKTMLNASPTNTEVGE